MVCFLEFHFTKYNNLKFFLSPLLLTGNGDCDTAVVQFVAYQEIHPRKLRKLFHLTRGYIKREAEEKGHLSQKHLMSLLSSIKQNVNGTPFINVILPMLEKAKLHNIVKKVRGRFLN